MKQVYLKTQAESHTRVRSYIGETDYFVEASTALTPRAKSVLSAAFFPALAGGYDVTGDGEVDKVFKENTDKLAVIASEWWSWKARNPISMPSAPAVPKPRGDAAMFFTGGVDSFCSLLRHPAEIQGLINVHGFDIPLTDTQRYATAKIWIENVARVCKIEPVYVTTNLRENTVFDGMNWEINHVSALSCVAHLLAGHFGRIFLASTDVPPPWGSNERIDPLWTSGNLQIINDGWHLSRLEKVKFISGSQLVHKYLKVCWENRSSDLNCGYCEKCVRTQAEFAAAGTYECLETFPRGPLVEKIEGIRFLDSHLVKQWGDIRREIKDPAVKKAIDRLLRRSRFYGRKGR